jgi:YesN/AraC family two-component response regulator
VSFTDVLTSVRVERAKELLAGTRLSVKQIAGRVGYSGGNYFAKVFRRVSGMSPSEYRLSGGGRRR